MILNQKFHFDIKIKQHAQMTTGTEARWQHFQHEADIGIYGEGASPAEAFTQAALAMTAVVTDLKLVKATECIELQCEAPDLEFLLVEWLNTLVYEMSVRKMLFSRFEVSITDCHLAATVCGEKVDRDRHQPAVEIKGATLTELYVGQQQDGSWQAQCVVDV
jgi:tRNA nucleotidyltransferase (CCA-adding enzyme)